jgi:hypothetical protein
MDRKSQIMTASGLHVLAGLCVIISPFVLGYADFGQPARTRGSAAASIDFIVGFVIAVLAVIRFFRAQSWS